MDPITRLSEIFRHFPGIGPRQAKRFVYYLLTRDKKVLKELSDHLLELRDIVRMCEDCYRFFEFKPHTSATSDAKCSICRNTHRDRTLIMIVAKDQDLETIEKSKTFHGVYFVLGGTIPLLDKAPEQAVRLREFRKRIEKGIKEDNLAEVIIAQNMNTEGEYTSSFIQGELEEMKQKHPFIISLLGRGLSTGTELEYSDSETLKFALGSRIKR